MPWEVEQKFRLNDAHAVCEQLAALGVAFDSPVEQIDRYFDHPARDFAQTDEAFRLRQVGERNFVTYKGPKVDPATKTRRELELDLPSGEAICQQFVELFTALGFRAVGAVRKRRRNGSLAWEGQCVVLALDDVESVGQFLELEIAADDQGLAPAKSSIQSLAQRLQLGSGERRSYLELLLESSP